LPEEVEAQVPYLYALGDMLPHLCIHTLTCTPIEKGTWKINLVVENSGYLPTFTSQQAKKRSIVRPVRVEMEIAEGCNLINGKLKSELAHLQGRSNELELVPIWESNPTDNRARLEWVITGKVGDQVVFHIISERAGTLHRVITLE